MRKWSLLNGAAVRQRRGKQETAIARGGTLPENAYYEDPKPTSYADKEYSDEHESDRKIIQ